jgi:hypothetical protein
MESVLLDAVVGGIRCATKKLVRHSFPQLTWNGHAFAPSGPPDRSAQRHA